MNKLKNIAMIAFAGLALTACNNNEEPQIDNAKILKIEARMCSEETRANSEGKGDKFLPGDVIKITNNEREFYPYITNEGTVDGIASFVPQTDAILERILSLDVGAYLDNGDERCGFDKFYLPEDQSTVEKLRKADWIATYEDPAGRYQEGYYRFIPNYQSQTTSKDQTVYFNMGHILSKVTVVISEYSSNMSNVNVGELKPTDATIYSKTRHGVESLEILNEGETIEISPLITQDKTKGNHKFTAIISGFYSEGETFLKFKFDGIEYTVTVNSELSKIFLESGKHYIINLKLNGKLSVSPSKVTVADWEEGGSYSVNLNNTQSYY